VRQALDDLDEVVLGVESLGLAVGQQGVEERVVGSGPGVAEEEVVFRAELGWTDFVLGEVVVDLKAAVFQADEDFFALVDGVGERFAQVVVGQLGLPGGERGQSLDLSIFSYFRRALMPAVSRRRVWICLLIEAG
jgi:hypothetical protein